MNLVILWFCTHIVVKDYLRWHKSSVNILKVVISYLYAAFSVVEVFELYFIDFKVLWTYDDVFD